VGGLKNGPYDVSDTCQSFFPRLLARQLQCEHIGGAAILAKITAPPVPLATWDLRIVLYWGGGAVKIPSSSLAIAAPKNLRHNATSEQQQTALTVQYYRHVGAPCWSSTPSAISSSDSEGWWRWQFSLSAFSSKASLPIDKTRVQTCKSVLTWLLHVLSYPSYTFSHSHCRILTACHWFSQWVQETCCLWCHAGKWQRQK
jgi:hypothetical protein